MNTYDHATKLHGTLSAKNALPSLCTTSHYVTLRHRVQHLLYYCLNGRSFPQPSKLALGPTQPPVQLVPRVLSPRTKRSGREVDYLPPSSADDKNEWSCTSIPQYAFVQLIVTTRPLFHNSGQFRAHDRWWGGGGGRGPTAFPMEWRGTKQRPSRSGRRTDYFKPSAAMLTRHDLRPCQHSASPNMAAPHGTRHCTKHRTKSTTRTDICHFLKDFNNFNTALFY
jgi:hypothetical protein